MSSVGIINFIYNEIIVSRALPSSSVYYNWFTGIYSYESIVIDWWRGSRNYSLVINKIYNSSRRHTLLLFTFNIHVMQCMFWERKNVHVYNLDVFQDQICNYVFPKYFREGASKLNCTWDLSSAKFSTAKSN